MNIPDAIFKSRLIDIGIDTNNDNQIQVSEAEAALSININGNEIGDLTGIEAFINIKELIIPSGYFTTADLSTLTQLEILNFKSCIFLVNLNISNSTLLKILNIYATDITDLNLENHTLLEDIDISACTNLNLDLNANINLKKLEAYNAGIYYSDFSTNVYLENLNLGSSEISEINISNNLQLVSLYLAYCDISQIDVSNNENLKVLSVAYTDVSTIDVSNNYLLEYLYVNDSDISLLDLSDLPNLIEVDAPNAEIETLILENNPALKKISIQQNALTSLDLSNAPNLERLTCNNNQLMTLNISNNDALLYLNAKQNELNTINLSNCLLLENVNLSNNYIFDIDLKNLYQLRYSNFSGNQLRNVDFSNQSELTFSSFGSGFNLSDNQHLAYANFKNGDNDTYNLSRLSGSFNNLPNLQNVCVDNENSAFAQKIQSLTPQTIIFTSDCPSNLILGKITYDADSNGCDVNDTNPPFMKTQSILGGTQTTQYSNYLGEYNIMVQAGNYSVSLNPENSSYYNSSPLIAEINFPANDNSEIVQDFCLTPNGNHNDLDIIITPLNQARPGFDASYSILLKNKGTTTLSGNVILNFDDDHLNYISSSQSPTFQHENILIWDYFDLEPFDSMDIDFVMNLNTPTDPNFPLNSDDILLYTATINPLASDETPEDNEFTFSQTVLNSLDTNDITCLQGDVIEIQVVGDYVHYIIRFENLGTAPAINVVVSNAIDTEKFDLSSMVPLQSSHNMITRIVNTNEIEFFFENINLPIDDENNDGFVTYKIKTQPHLIVGDIFNNQAKIFFDFNAAIITNIATTEVIDEILNVPNYYLKSNYTIYPNPSSGYLNVISIKDIINKIDIYDFMGKKLITKNKVNSFSTDLDISKLASGLYFAIINNADIIQISKR